MVSAPITEYFTFVRSPMTFCGQYRCESVFQKLSQNHFGPLTTALTAIGFIVVGLVPQDGRSTIWTYAFLRRIEAE